MPSTRDVTGTARHEPWLSVVCGTSTGPANRRRPPICRSRHGPGSEHSRSLPTTKVTSRVGGVGWHELVDVEVDLGVAVDGGNAKPTRPTIIAVSQWDDSAGVVEFPDGRRIRGRGLRRPLPAGPEPHFGVYLVGRDPGAFGWDHRWVRWPDFRTPSSPDDAVAALAAAYARAENERVEVACGGGIGRTGTALAVIAILAGVERLQAVQWVRQHYHRRAVETPWQRRWVENIAAIGP